MLYTSAGRPGLLLSPQADALLSHVFAGKLEVYPQQGPSAFLAAHMGGLPSLGAGGLAGGLWGCRGEAFVQHSLCGLSATWDPSLSPLLPLTETRLLACSCACASVCETCLAALLQAGCSTALQNEGTRSQVILMRAGAWGVQQGGGGRAVSQQRVLLGAVHLSH